MAILTLGNNNSEFSGSFSGSFVGDGSQLTGIETDPFPYTGDAQITGSLLVSGSSVEFKTSGGTVFSIAETGSFTLGEGATNSSDTNVTIGRSAISNGAFNIAIGKDADNDGSSYNIAIGSGANTTNTAYGIAIGGSTYAKESTIAIGHSSTGGTGTVAIGYDAGSDAGDYNVLLGYAAGKSTTGDNNIIIGSGSLGAASMANQLRIGHSDVIAISGSLTTGDVIFASTASAAYFVGDGSQLTNLPASDPFPFTGSADISGSLSVTDTVSLLNFDKDSGTIGPTVNDSWELGIGTTADSGAKVRLQHGTYHDTGLLIHGRSSIASYTPLLVRDGSSVSLLSVLSDGLVTAHKKFKVGGDATITGSLVVSGSSGVEINNSLLVTGSGANITIANTLSGAQNSFEILNNSNQKIFQVGNWDKIVFGAGATATDGTSQVWGGVASSAAQYSTVIGYDADHTTGTRGIAIGASAKSKEIGAIGIGVGAQAYKHDIAIGRNIAYSGTPENSVIFNTFAGNSITYSTTNAFEWYNTHATAPNLRFLTGPTSQSFWSGSGGFFGFGTTTPDAPLTVEGSGSTVFDVIGSQGTLFSVDDDLSGTLFTANDVSGLPVLEASASGEVYIGKSPQSLYTTAVISSTTAATTQSIFGLSTSSYDGAFFDYTVQSGSNARAGNIMTVWNGSTINFTETTTTDIGDTTDFNLIVHISQSQAQIASHATNAGYKIKTIIRSI